MKRPGCFFYTELELSLCLIVYTALSIPCTHILVSVAMLRSSKGDNTRFRVDVFYCLIATVIQGLT